jgi:hypothetical protein
VVEKWHVGRTRECSIGAIKMRWSAAAVLKAHFELRIAIQSRLWCVKGNARKRTEQGEVVNGDLMRSLVSKADIQFVYLVIEVEYY